MVQHFNQHSTAPRKLNILSAIYLIADAWESIPATTIHNCWIRSGLLDSNLPRDLSEAASVEAEGLAFLRVSESYTRNALRFLNPDIPASELEHHFTQYLTDSADDEYSSRPTVVPSTISLVEAEVNLGFRSRGVENMEVLEYDASGDTDDESITTEIRLPITNHKAIQHLQELSFYLQSLRVS